MGGSEERNGERGVVGGRGFGVRFGVQAAGSYTTYLEPVHLLLVVCRDGVLREGPLESVEDRGQDLQLGRAAAAVGSHSQWEAIRSQLEGSAACHSQSMLFIIRIIVTTIIIIVDVVSAGTRVPA